MRLLLNNASFCYYTIQMLQNTCVITNISVKNVPHMLLNMQIWIKNVLLKIMLLKILLLKILLLKIMLQKAENYQIIWEKKHSVVV